MSQLEKQRALIELVRRGSLTKEQLLAAKELAKRQGIELPVEQMPQGATQQPTESSAASSAKYGLKGLYSAGAGLLGLPVDVSAFALRQLGLPAADEPFMGSDYMRGKLADVGYGYKTIQDVPEQFRSSAVAGETLGAALTGGAGIARLAASKAPATLRAAKDLLKPPSTITRVGRGIVDTARAAPVATFATEAGIGAAAGVGAGIAEEVAPSSLTARVIGETAASLSPTLLVSRFLPSAVQKLTMAIKTKGPAGAKNEAAKILQEGLIDEGFDPAVYAQQNLSNQAGIESLTAAQVGDSQYISRLEKTLISESKNLGADYANRAKESVAAFNKKYTDLLKTGDPDAIIVAAQARKEYLDGLLEGRVAKASEKAREASKSIEGFENIDATNASVKSKEIVEDALRDARATETYLWGRLAKDVDVKPTATVSAIESAQSRLLQEVNLPNPIQKFSERALRAAQEPDEQNLDEVIARVFGEKFPDGKKSGSIVDSGDMLEVRSIALTQGRLLRSQGNFKDAGIMDSIADAALVDIESVLGPSATQVARGFSRKLNDVFTNSFAGKILGKTKTGAERMAEEDVLRRAVSGGRAAPMRELRQAAEPMSTGPFSEEIASRPKQMLDAQKDFILSLANNARNPVTDELDVARLSRFIRSNEMIIDELGLTQQLSDIKSAQVFAQKTLETQRKASAFFEKRKIAAKFLKSEDPVKVVARAFQSDTPSKSFLDMVRLARTDKSGEALNGLRSAVFETVFNKSISEKTGSISSAQLDGFLNRVIPSTGRTMRNELIASGVMTKSQSDSLNRISAQAKKFESALSEGKTIEGLLENESTIFDLITRLIGSKLGTAGIAGKTAGSSLVMAGAGVRAAQKQMLKLPSAKVKDVLIQAVLDPKFMAILLQKNVGVNVRRKNTSRIEAYLLRNLLIEEDEQE
jgi:hypothetical protein